MKLTELKNKEVAIVKRIDGGERLFRRLESLGVREGCAITKLGAHFWRGPVTVIVGKTKIAIGRSMAEKIIVGKNEE